MELKGREDPVVDDNGELCCLVLIIGRTGGIGPYGGGLFCGWRGSGSVRKGGLLVLDVNLPGGDGLSFLAD